MIYDVYQRNRGFAGEAAVPDGDEGEGDAWLTCRTDLGEAQTEARRYAEQHPGLMFYWVERGKVVIPRENVLW